MKPMNFSSTNKNRPCCRLPEYSECAGSGDPALSPTVLRPAAVVVLLLLLLPPPPSLPPHPHHSTSFFSSTNKNRPCCRLPEYSECAGSGDPALSPTVLRPAAVVVLLLLLLPTPPPPSSTSFFSSTNKNCPCCRFPEYSEGAGSGDPALSPTVLRPAAVVVLLLLLLPTATHHPRCLHLLLLLH